jgi:hypothetical protein
MSIPVKFPVAGSMLKTFTMAPRSLCQSVGRQFCAEDAVTDAITRARATVMRYMFFVSNLVEYVLDPVQRPGPRDVSFVTARAPRSRAVSSTLDTENIRTGLQRWQHQQQQRYQRQPQHQHRNGHHD